MDSPKFLVDRMLGRLVAWLRIFDYDTLSALELGIAEDEDSCLVQIALEERRILLSRDRQLIERALKAGAPALLLSPDHVKDQLFELLKHYQMQTVPVMERCTVCNASLRKASGADQEKIAADVHRHLLDEQKEFWVCDRCGKVYWQGSHWRNIRKLADELGRGPAKKDA